MSMVVDTCVLLDILDAHPDFSLSSALALNRYSSFGLVIAPITYVELAPAFNGDRDLQNQFLNGLGITLPETVEYEVLAEAHATWYNHILRKRTCKVAKRPIADVMIGALASVNDGLITRNAKDFRILFPRLNIVVP